MVILAPAGRPGGSGGSEEGGRPGLPPWSASNPCVTLNPDLPPLRHRPDTVVVGGW